MDTNFKNALKSVSILYIIEEGVEHDYHVMPFEVMCERIHVTDCKNAWNDYLNIHPNIVMIHMVSNYDFYEELIFNIQKEYPQCAFLILANESLRKSINPLLLKNSKILFLPITFELLIMTLKEIVESNALNYYLDGKILFSPSNSLLIKDLNRIELTSKENKLLSLLVHNSNRIVTYEEIENYIWQGESMSRNTLTSIMSNIRKKIGDNNVIVNYSNQGYKVKMHNFSLNES